MLPDQKPVKKSKNAAASSRTSKRLKVERPPNLKEEGSSQPVDSKEAVDQTKADEEERQMVTALIKGAAIVDPKCPIADRAHVYSQGNDVYGMNFLS